MLPSEDGKLSAWAMMTQFTSDVPWSDHQLCARTHRVPLGGTWTPFGLGLREATARHGDMFVVETS